MGTTLTATTVDEQARISGTSATAARTCCERAHSGQLTDDHTLVNRMVKAGEITQQEAGTHPHRNVLTRSIGHRTRSMSTKTISP